MGYLPPFINSLPEAIQLVEKKILLYHWKQERGLSYVPETLDSGEDRILKQGGKIASGLSYLHLEETLFSMSAF